MVIDILLLFVLIYGLYLGYTQGVFKVSLLALAIIGGLLCSMYMTAPATEFVANFFGIHHRLLPLLIFLFIVLLFALIGVLIYKKAKKNLKNTKIGEAEKYFGAFSMAVFFSFLFAVILSFFTAADAIKKENKENSFSYTALENISDSGMGLIKKLAPFVSTFVKTISAQEMNDQDKSTKYKKDE
jgi:uncharacterized membrane protein required for colicin V production